MLSSLREGGREESRWTEGRGERDESSRVFPSHTHKHTRPHPHLAAGLLPSSHPFDGMSGWD